MEKGIIYVMTTAVSGLIKIGKTKTEQFQKRMRFLEANGYYNVSGLKRCFAIELDNYSDKELLLHEIFGKHQVAESELFALDVGLIQQLLLSFEGQVIYPEEINKDKDFKEITKVRKQGTLFSFYKKGLKNGEKLTFTGDRNIEVKIAGEREVEYCGQIYKLSPLVYKLFEQQGKLNTSGAYQGANYFEYHGVKLTKLQDKD